MMEQKKDNNNIVLFTLVFPPQGQSSLAALFNGKIYIERESEKEIKNKKI